MIRTRMRQVIELIRKHPKMRRILRCESPYFHHWHSGTLDENSTNASSFSRATALSWFRGPGHTVRLSVCRVDWLRLSSNTALRWDLSGRRDWDVRPGSRHNCLTNENNLGLSPPLSYCAETVFDGTTATARKPLKSSFRWVKTWVADFATQHLRGLILTQEWVLWKTSALSVILTLSELKLAS